MKKNSFSLKKSLFLSIVIASAFQIIAFTHLHLTREAFRTTEHQIRETQLSLLLTKEVLETRLANASNADYTLVIKALEDLASKMTVLQKALLLQKDGTVIYPKFSKNPSAELDQERIREILLTYDLTNQWFRPLPSPNRKDGLDIFTPIFSNEGVELILKTSITLDNLKDAFLRTYRFVLLIFFMVLTFSIFLGLRVTKKILNPIKRLYRHTQELSKGNLKEPLTLETGDEFEELAESFNQMSRDLSEMKNKAEDANPLTHLPGNNVISSFIDKRLEVGAKIAVVHADLDRFKIYNDMYGIQRGDEVIKMTAEVLKEAVLEEGSADDLVAHEGGDDFVIVTVPANLERIAKSVIQKFDLRKGNYYRQNDRERNGILIPDRRAKDPAGSPKVEIPLMSISLAAVTNETQSFSTYTAIASALVAMKKKAKGIQGSSFAVSR